MALRRLLPPKSATIVLENQTVEPGSTRAMRRAGCESLSATGREGHFPISRYAKTSSPMRCIVTRMAGPASTRSANVPLKTCRSFRREAARFDSKPRSAALAAATSKKFCSPALLMHEPCPNRSDRSNRWRRYRSARRVARPSCARRPRTGPATLFGSSDFEEVAAICNRVSGRP